MDHYHGILEGGAVCEFEDRLVDVVEVVRRREKNNGTIPLPGNFRAKVQAEVVSWHVLAVAVWEE